MKQVIQNSLNILQNIQPDSTAETLEKGKSAQIGEIREWSDGKYRKTASGWEPVKESKPKDEMEFEEDKDSGSQNDYESNNASEHRRAVERGFEDQEKQKKHEPDYGNKEDVQFKKNVKISKEWDSLYKRDRGELIQIFRSEVKVNNLSERELKEEIVNAIMSERYYKQNWEYIPKSKRS